MSLSQEQTRRILALADKLAGPIRDAFIAAIKAKAATLNAAEVDAALGDAILTGNAERLTAMLKLTPDQIFPITEAIRSSYIAGLSFGKEGLPITLRANFGFGGNPRAVAAVRDLVTKLTGEISQGQIDATRALVAGVVDNGIPVRLIVSARFFNSRAMCCVVMPVASSAVSARPSLIARRTLASNRRSVVV